MPHDASEAGIGCRFSQPPLAYWKKSTAGLTVVSRSAARKSPEAGAVVVFVVTGEVLQAAMKPRAARKLLGLTAMLIWEKLAMGRSKIQSRRRLIPPPRCRCSAKLSI